MERYAFPRIGRRPVSEVNTADVLEILTPIWHVKPEPHRAVRQRIRSVLEWVTAMDLRKDNPCDRGLPVLVRRTTSSSTIRRCRTGTRPRPSRWCGRPNQHSRP